MRIPTLVLLMLLASLPSAAQAPAPHARANATALDRYVAEPDPHFAWNVAGPLPGGNGVTASLIEMTSQAWLSPADVDRPVWTHWLIVARPERVTSDVGFVFVGGGENGGKPPAKVDGWLLDLARDTGTVVAQLRMVPNQPLTFAADPEKKARVEDEIIAWAWDRYLRTGDTRWLPRLPMTKSVVRAMDAVTAWSATAEGGGRAVARYVIAGGSKRGWTTWTTAAVDARVIGIVPAVIDMLNLVPSFQHHWRAYGFWAPAVKDYVDHGIMEWMGTPEFQALLKEVEPYEYRDRLTMPKLILNAAGDEFFLPDSSQFYFADLAGEKHLRYVPNANHSLRDTDAFQSLHAFYASIVAGRERPRVSWTFEPDGAIRVTASEAPAAVTLWQAGNAEARDFRLDTIGAGWTSTPLTASGPNTWVARVPPPAAGWTAYFVELKFPSGGRVPFTFTTAVRVVPDTLPFPAPAPRRSH